MIRNRLSGPSEYHWMMSRAEEDAEFARPIKPSAPRFSAIVLAAGLAIGAVAALVAGGVAATAPQTETASSSLSRDSSDFRP